MSVAVYCVAVSATPSTTPPHCKAKCNAHVCLEWSVRPASTQTDLLWMKGALYREWNLSLQCFLYVPQNYSQIARTFNRFLEASHTPWRRRRAEWPWTIILPPLSFHVLALHKSLSIQHFSSQTTHSIKQQIRAKRAMEEIEIVYFLLIFRGVTAVVYICTNYAVSGPEQ